VPQAHFEIGLIYRKLGQFQQAKACFKKTRHDFSGYLTETMINSRVECALVSMQ